MWKLTSILALLFVTASGRYYPSRSSFKLKDDHDDPTVSSGKRTFRQGFMVSFENVFIPHSYDRILEAEIE